MSLCKGEVGSLELAKVEGEDRVVLGPPHTQYMLTHQTREGEEGISKIKDAERLVTLWKDAQCSIRMPHKKKRQRSWRYRSF